MYTFPGGHVEEGENHRDAVIREVLEETNVKIDPVRRLYKYRFERIASNGDKLSDMQSFFICDYQSGTAGTTDAEEYAQDGTEIGHDGRPRGTYEPAWVLLTGLDSLDLRPAAVKHQLILDIKKYGVRVSRPTILVQ